MVNVLDELGRRRLVPVLVVDDAEVATPLGDALCAGGLPVAEVTLRTDAALTTLRTLAARGDMLIGAGTVLSIDAVNRATDAGAKFIVTPGIDPKVVEYCLANNILITPGTLTATDMTLAVSLGVSVVKFFPAENFGGIKTLKALANPFHMLRFIPTGSITLAVLPDYLAFKPVVAVGGGWLATRDLLAARNFAEITRLTSEAVAVINQA